MVETRLETVWIDLFYVLVSVFDAVVQLLIFNIYSFTSKIQSFVPWYVLFSPDIDFESHSCSVNLQQSDLLDKRFIGKYLLLGHFSCLIIRKVKEESNQIKIKLDFFNLTNHVTMFYFKCVTYISHVMDKLEKVNWKWRPNNKCWVIISENCVTKRIIMYFRT